MSNKVSYEKVLTKKSYEAELITQWVKIKGFDLSACTINDPVMKMSLNLAFGNFDEFKKFMKKDYDKEVVFNDAHALAFSFDDKDHTRWNWVLITENDWYAADYGTICHELHHFTHFGLTEKGVNYGEGGEEVYAYTQGFFMEMVVRAFMELKKIKKHAPKHKRNTK